MRKRRRQEWLLRLVLGEPPVGASLPNDSSAPTPCLRTTCSPPSASSLSWGAPLLRCRSLPSGWAEGWGLAARWGMGRPKRGPLREGGKSRNDADSGRATWMDCSTASAPAPAPAVAAPARAPAVAAAEPAAAAPAPPAVATRRREGKPRRSRRGAPLLKGPRVLQPMQRQGLPRHTRGKDLAWQDAAVQQMGRYRKKAFR